MTCLFPVADKVGNDPDSATDLRRIQNVFVADATGMLWFPLVAELRRCVIDVAVIQNLFFCRAPAERGVFSTSPLLLWCYGPMEHVYPV